MKFVFVHHEPHGPIALADVWQGSHSYAGSVSRLRVLFWLAARGHDVVVAGNVVAGSFRGVTAVSSIDPALDMHAPAGVDAVVVLNNPCSDALWEQLTRKRRTLILWAGNPFDHVWIARAERRSLARIVCVSHWHRDLYRIYRAFPFIEVVYSGVDVDLIDRAEPESAAVGAAVFCSIPRRTKGIRHVLKAWPLVRRALPDARLRICGSALMHDPAAVVGPSGVLDADVEAEFGDLLHGPGSHGITLLGVRGLSHVFAEMKGAAAVLVNCNTGGSSETFCRTAVEARIAGAVVIGADAGALPEVGTDSTLGILLKRTDAASLSEAIIRVLTGVAPTQNMRDVERSRALGFAEYGRIAAVWESVGLRAFTEAASPSPRDAARDALRMLRYGSVRARARRLIRGSGLERVIIRLLAS
jgi:glycosyltransferase involved in cell wall biosynthesis